MIPLTDFPRGPWTPSTLVTKPCARCNARSSLHQWDVCALGGSVPLCSACDRVLNQLVLLWLGERRVSWRMKRYHRKQKKAEGALRRFVANRRRAGKGGLMWGT